MHNNIPFIHLHVHSEYSMLDGVSRISEIVSRVKDLGMNSVALTDHGVMYGVYEFWSTCNNAGIKPIIGCEIYVSPKEMGLRQDVNGIKYYHLLLLAKNLTGYKNLIKLVSRAHLEGFYYKPRADKNLLSEYAEGIICTSACAAGPLGRHILRDEAPLALEWLNFLRDLYKDDFYIEIQRHGLKSGDKMPTELRDYTDEQIQGMKEQIKINKKLIEWASEYKIPMIATTDSHYNVSNDELTQEVLFAIKDGKTLDDITRRTAYKHTYIKSVEEMEDTFKDLPDALINTQKLADKVEQFDIRFGRVQPKFPKIPGNLTAKEYLRQLTLEGANIKYGKVDEALLERINMELDVIHDKGYDEYFLVVSDIMRWARSQGIIVGVRGSGGGSVVAYSLEIINIEPISWELYFERFLNPMRPSPPDIDMDIQDSRRDEVMDYVVKTYGKDNVCAISAFGRLKTRTAIRDVSRVMKIDLSIADQLSKMVEILFGKPKSIDFFFSFLSFST